MYLHQFIHQIRDKYEHRKDVLAHKLLEDISARRMQKIYKKSIKRYGDEMKTRQQRFFRSNVSLVHLVTKELHKERA